MRPCRSSPSWSAPRTARGTTACAGGPTRRASSSRGRTAGSPSWAAKTLLTVKLQQLEARGETMGEPERAEFMAPILAKYEAEGDPYYATARLWDDGILEPLETRDALGLALAAALGAPIPATRFGVFRM